MTVWNAVVLGLVQGIAEFLPVSSSGHLSIINNLFNMSDVQSGHMLFDVLLHLATLISILIVYWPDIVNITYESLAFINLGPLAGQPRMHYPAARMLFMIIIATLPLLLILPIKDMIETLYYRNVFIGVALILTGCMLYVSDKMTPGKKTERSMSVLDALIIGLCQCVAVVPGLSRSGTTITAGIATGLRRDFAVKFSFLMSLPAVLGANILSLVDAFQSEINWSYVPAYLVGMAVALVSGIAAINLLRYISSKGKFGGFAYYCWVVGVLSIILTMIF
ncbi:MAG: undecaprenyl-diphosphate phosphatase [Candidatus Limivicinus sp.]|nr:undecaprenyl-diphosphate phosphatase [Clostridiales bacterium]MDY3860251.1 undecaprenyl-diphosphate phosphatase [Candidatus Limivicinus sp.]